MATPAGVRRIVIVDKSSNQIPSPEVALVAKALQLQVNRDFFPLWGGHVKARPLSAGEAVSPNEWPVYIVDTPSAGLGVHLDKGHKPYAQVEHTKDWSITASHELLEMLADPFGQRLVQGPDINPKSDGHTVEYLVEVADPCETFSYDVDSVKVSDFVTPAYYNPSSSSKQAFDAMGRLSAPYEVPRGCYISWEDPADGRWHQKQPDGKFVRAEAAFDPKGNPRDERDNAFGPEEGKKRHNLPEIINEYRLAS